MAVDTRGNAWGWGTNPFGDALCLGTRAPVLTPVKLPLRHVTAAAGAFGHGVYVAAPVFVLRGVRDISGTNFDVAVSLREGGRR